MISQITFKEKEGYIPLFSILENNPWTYNPLRLRVTINRYEIFKNSAASVYRTDSKEYIHDLVRKLFININSKNLMDEVFEMKVKYGDNYDQLKKDVIDYIHNHKDDVYKGFYARCYKYTDSGSLNHSQILNWIKDSSINLHVSLDTYIASYRGYGSLKHVFLTKIYDNIRQTISVGANTYEFKGGVVLKMERPSTITIKYTGSNMYLGNYTPILAVYVDKNMVKLIKLMLILGYPIPGEFFRLYLNPFAPKSFIQWFNKNKEDMFYNIPVYTNADLIFHYKLDNSSSLMEIEQEYETLISGIKKELSSGLIREPMPF